MGTKSNEKLPSAVVITVKDSFVATFCNVIPTPPMPNIPVGGVAVLSLSNNNLPDTIAIILSSPCYCGVVP
jgi:hypothetical protein